MTEQGLLKKFLVEFGYALIIASLEAQDTYDKARCFEEFQHAQLLRTILLDRVPELISEAAAEPMGVDEFDYLEWYAHQREVVVNKTAAPDKFIVRILRRLLKWLTKR